MKAQTIFLSEVIGLFEDSIAKRPKVISHDKLVNLLPKMQEMLKRGDFPIPIAEFTKVLQGK